MNALDYVLRFPWVEPLGRTLIHFLWQGALIGLAAFLFLRSARRRSPELRYALAAGALALCAAVPLATFLLLARPWQSTSPSLPAAAPAPTVITVPAYGAPSPTPPRTVAAAPPRQISRAPSLRDSLSPNLSTWPQSAAARLAVGFWIAGVLLLGLRLAVGWVRVQCWRGGARPVPDPPTVGCFHELAARLGIDARRVRLLVSRAATLPGPLAMGVFRPAVLLPAWILEQLPLSQIEALLAHELAHIRRHDYLWNLLTSALEVVLFYHPAVWFLGRELRAAREERCDLLAASACADRVVYARALAAVAEWRVSAAAAVPAPAAARGLLVTRVRRILGLDLPPDPLLTGRNAGWILAFAGIALAAAGILYSGKLMAQNSELDDPGVPTLIRAAPHGSVVDRQGHPVPGARVLLYRTVSQWGLGNRVEAEVLAGSDGAFTFSQPLRIRNPAAVQRTPEYTLFAVAPGHAPAAALISPDTPEGQPVTLPLPAAKPQTYEVVDKAGRPVEGASVWLRWAENPPGDNISTFPENETICRAFSDAAGRATLDNLPDCRVSIAASKAGFENEYGADPGPGGVSRFTLKPEGALEGRVTDPLGRPVEGATVSLYPKFRFHQYFLAKTDAAGHYRVDKIWADREAHRDQPDWGKYEVAVRHPLLTAATREVSFSSGQTIKSFDIAASPGVKIAGRVLDPVTKAPVPGAGVLADSQSGRQAFLTGADGGFHGRVMPGKVSAFFSGPPRGSFVIEDDGGRWERLPSRVQTQAGGDRLEIELYLPSALGRLGTVTGRVNTADGQPAARCEVLATLETGRLRSGSWTGSPLRAVKTDAEGKFVIGEFPIGPVFTLNARTENNTATGKLTVKLAGGTLDLPAPVVLQPTAPGGEFLLTDRHGKPRAHLAVSVGPVPAGKTYPVQKDQLTSDEAGILRVPRCVPGARYAVILVGPYGMNRIVNVFDTPPAEAGAAPPPRRTLVIDTEGVVRLLGPDEQAIPVKRIVSFEAEIIHDGRKTRWSNDLPVIGREGADAIIPWDNLVGMRGGTASFLIETDDGAHTRAEGTAPLDGSNLFVIRTSEILRPDAIPDPGITVAGPEEIAGRVVTPKGEPVAGAAVRMPGVHFQEEKEPPVLSGADGMFRLVRPKYRFSCLTVEKEGWATAFLTDLPAGKGFRVVLQRDTHVRGNVGGENPGRVSLLLKKNKFTQNEDSLNHELRDLQLRLTTDEHGMYDFPVEPGRYRWEASSADGRFARGETTVERGKTLDLGVVLASGYDVTFELVDFQSGQPVPGIEVAIFEQRADRVYSPRAGSAKTSDAQGRIHWENLPPGEKQFDAQRMRGRQAMPGREQHAYSRWWRAEEPLTRRKTVIDGQAPSGDQGIYPIYVDVQAGLAPVKIFMERGVKLSGRVITADGKGAPYVSIQAMAQPGGALANFSDQTDKDGNFICYVPAGNGIAYNLSVYTWSAPGSAPGANVVSERFSSKPGDERTFQLVMGKGGWFTGRLMTAEGKPAAGFKITAVAGDGLETVFAARIVTAGEDGRFRLGPLRPGNYQVHPGTGAGAPLEKLPGSEEKTGEIAADGDTRDLGDIVLPAGATQAASANPGPADGSAPVPTPSPAAPALAYKLTVTPDVKKAFQGSDGIEIREITGTAANFQVDGIYRISGVCRQQTLTNAALYIGNTTEAGSDAIAPVAGSSLYKTLSRGSTEFDCTFKLLRPGVLHLTIYDLNNDDKKDNAYAGIKLGEIVSRP